MNTSKDSKSFSPVLLFLDLKRNFFTCSVTPSDIGLEAVPGSYKVKTKFRNTCFVSKVFSVLLYNYD